MQVTTRDAAGVFVGSHRAEDDTDTDVAEIVHRVGVTSLTITYDDGHTKLFTRHEEGG